MFYKGRGDNTMINIGIICTPTHIHQQFTHWAVENNIHVLCEKPFCLDYHLAEELVKSANDKNIRMMVLQVVRFSPEYIEIKYTIEDGQIEYFIECVEENKDIEKMKMEDVIYILKVIDAIKTSLETNHVVTNIQ